MSNRLNLAEELMGELVTLRRYRLSDVSAVKGSVEASFEELKPWMPWAQETPTDGSVHDFVERSATRFGGDAGDEDVGTYAITLTDGGEYVGSCGLSPRGPDAFEIGYWVDTRFTGRGIATETARILTVAAFELPSVTRCEIRCDEANARSAAVPRRLGYTLKCIQNKPPQSPGETGRQMLWTRVRE